MEGNPSAPALIASIEEESRRGTMKKKEVDCPPWLLKLRTMATNEEMTTALPQSAVLSAAVTVAGMGDKNGSATSALQATATMGRQLFGSMMCT
jgi:hypothetical protein